MTVSGWCSRHYVELMIPVRRRVVRLGVVLAIVAVAGAASLALWWSRDSGTPEWSARNQGTASTSSTPNEDVQARAVEALVKRLPKALADGDASVLSSAARERGMDLKAALPPNAVLTMDPASWRRTGALGSATVTLSVTGQEPLRFVLVVIREDGSWKVSATYQIGTS
jgi:hypothetical protein